MIHPHNPHVPTSHANVRFFIAEKDGEEGCDGSVAALTSRPTMATRKTASTGTAWLDTPVRGLADVYARYKAWCDSYFHIKHRNDPVASAGLFFVAERAGLPDLRCLHPAPSATPISTLTCRSCSAANGLYRTAARFRSSVPAATWSSTWCTTVARPVRPAIGRTYRVDPDVAAAAGYAGAATGRPRPAAKRHASPTTSCKTATG